MICRGLTIIVAGYWLALFAATHVPRVPESLTMPGGDKWHHALAYAGLSFLLGVWQAFRGPLTRKLALRIACIVILYGIIDELSQIPAGRNAEFMDWLADVVGTLLGLGVLTLVRAILPRSSAAPPPESGSPRPHRLADPDLTEM